MKSGIGSSVIAMALLAALAMPVSLAAQDKAKQHNSKHHQ
jgi:hypothetical protein